MAVAVAVWIKLSAAGPQQSDDAHLLQLHDIFPATSGDAIPPGIC